MKKLFILVLGIMTTVNFAYASMGFDAGTLNRDYVQDMRLHEFQTRERNKVKLIQEENKANDSKLDIPVSTVIKKITFVGNETIPSDDLLKLVESRIGQSANEQNVVGMRKLISRFYNANGFYSALVLPDISKLSEGELIFQIKEGGKNSITIQ